ncbi:kinase-like domain-containing protein [Aspergillus pseudonomiae]|uniref:Kinase-like domain-containing protein n=1 Tax=Aspergillus pseudonomiae TaxID=1506151 RepID=A0A5N7CU16_9EURO|nr:kinase-like domain-containing protein [Aspergillus pseudonomiae]KAE8397696.1 kinase-like domain-containing protein [Aspergillus pseudonomiae]
MDDGTKKTRQKLKPVWNFFLSREPHKFTFAGVGHQKRLKTRNGKHYHFLERQALGCDLPQKIQYSILRCFRPCSRSRFDPAVWFVDGDGTLRINLIGDTASLDSIQEYGDPIRTIGYGSFGIVLLVRRVIKEGSPSYGVHALKVFRHRRGESGFQYHYRIASQFSITSSLKHQNIVNTFQLDPIGQYSLCMSMEFCSGGDLHTLIIDSRQLEETEADCFFKQLIRGLTHIHHMDIAHRDLKPQNLLLTSQGCLKISDFDIAERCHYTRDGRPHTTDRLCGSAQYISPEQYTKKKFDPRAADVWATGVTYIAMRVGWIPWEIAEPEEDDGFRKFLQCIGNSGYDPIGRLSHICQNVIWSLLDPIPSRRPTAHSIIQSLWMQEVLVCEAGEYGY